MRDVNKLDKAVQIKRKTPSVNPDYNTRAGDAGEYEVRDKLIYSRYPMYLLHDVRLTTNDGKTAQIDFIAVTKYIIFVIECKNFGFNVKVDSEGQFIDTDKNKSFKSPLEQNREHIDVLTRIFPEYEDRFFPIIVFSNALCILNLDETPDELKKHITRLDNLIPKMQEINEANKKTGFLFKKGLDELSDEEMKRYAEDFLAHHKERSMPAEEKTAPQNTDSGLVCPNCKKEVRKGQYGFYCTAKCGMNLTKVYGYELSEKQIVYLLKNSGKALKINIGGTESIIYAEAVKNGRFIQWKVVKKSAPAEKKPVSEVKEVPKNTRKGFICPNCKKEVRKGQYGFYCTAKCGMNLTKIYGQDIPEEQVKNLLSGNEVEINTKYGQKTLAPNAVKKESNGRIFIQWAVK